VEHPRVGPDRAILRHHLKRAVVLKRAVDDAATELGNDIDRPYGGQLTAHSASSKTAGPGPARDLALDSAPLVPGSSEVFEVLDAVGVGGLAEVSVGSVVGDDRVKSVSCGG
jgi:hypothetical protein